MAKKLFEAVELKCAFDHGHSCAALNIKKCKGCSFFKTETELEEGRRRSQERLKTLSAIEQKRIYDSYHCKYTQKF